MEQQLMNTIDWKLWLRRVIALPLMILSWAILLVLLPFSLLARLYLLVKLGGRAQPRFGRALLRGAQFAIQTLGLYLMWFHR
jgi:hypothetical protein